MKGCVLHHNIVGYATKTLEECKSLCSAEPKCLAFEYGVQYGGRATRPPGYCQLNDSVDRAKCDGVINNVDLFVKNPDCKFDGKPYLSSLP